MKLIEIDTKYFYFTEGVVDLLESYSDPVNELNISFNQIHTELGNHYYGAEVRERNTSDMVIHIDFSIYNDNPNAIIVDNIIPNQSKVDPSKIVHTSIGDQNTGVDMGHVAMKWVFNEIKKFAISSGYDIKKLKSSTRYTGARAKNDPGGSVPKNFNVDVNIKESIIYSYSCNNNELSIYKE
jgi:hypothetical protein